MASFGGAIVVSEMEHLTYAILHKRTQKMLEFEGFLPFQRAKKATESTALIAPQATRTPKQTHFEHREPCS
jgi:hypothetical protein